MRRTSSCLSRPLGTGLLTLSLSALLAASSAHGQSAQQAPTANFLSSSSSSLSSPAYSSSTDPSLGTDIATNEGLNLFSSSSARPEGNGQYGGGYGNGGYRQYPKYGQPGFHHIAIEAGAGFDAPLGNTKSAQTFGYNIKVGGGWNFSRKFGVLLEYEFNHTGIPDSVLAAVAAQAGVGVNGSVHVWGFSLDPVYYYKTTGSWGGYVTGGGGFYRKLTTFSTPIDLGTVCSFYYGCYEQYGNQTISHFSSNQGGLNLGTGITHTISDSGTKIYAEARYLWVDSPRSSATQPGSGTVSMIPVTFGIRF